MDCDAFSFCKQASHQSSVLGFGVDSKRHLATCSAVDFASDVGGLVAGKKDEDWSKFGRLSSAPEKSIRTELFYLLLGHGGRNEGSPDRTWSYRVDAHALLNRKAG